MYSKRDKSFYFTTFERWSQATSTRSSIKTYAFKTCPISHMQVVSGWLIIVSRPNTWWSHPLVNYSLSSGTQSADSKGNLNHDESDMVHACYWLHPTDHIHKEGTEKGSKSNTSSASCSDIDDSYLHRFQSIRALRVTDLFGSEWCEKQMDNFLLLDERKVSKAMELGQARQEVVERVMKKLSISLGSEEEIVENVTKKFNKFEELEEEVVEKVTKKFNHFTELQEEVAEKVVRFIGQKLENVLEKVTKRFNEFEELQEEIGFKVTKKFSKFKELEEEVVEKFTKTFSDLELEAEVFEKLTRTFQPGFNKRYLGDENNPANTMVVEEDYKEELEEEV